MAYKAIAAGYLVRDNKVLLIHHKKFNKWTPPGGHLEENETPDQGVIRECKEELGLDVEVLPAMEVVFAGEGKDFPIPMPFYLDVESNYFDTPRLGYYFYIKPVGQETELVMQASEIHDAKWFGKDDLEALETFPQVRALAKYAIDNYPKNL